MVKEGGPYKAGQQFGPYTLQEYLGSGAYKSVYKAFRKDAASDRPQTVALGFPHQQDEDGINELKKEHLISGRLIHPNILRVYEVEEHEGVSFMVMEYLEGETLRSRFKRTGVLPPQEALRYIGLITEALAYAHSARILHRDIKPENIFITPDGTPKLLDFGIARILQHTNSLASTRVGTIAYMSPEQFQGAAGTNADLWSVGITFHEILVGTRPFTGETGEMMHRIMHTPLNEKTLQEAGVDHRIIRVLRKILNKDPQLRYGSAEELANELELVARRVRLIEDDEGRLEVIIRASFPLIYVLSTEEQRVLESITRIAERLGAERQKTRPVYVWSGSRGLRDSENELISDKTFKEPTAALIHAIENTQDAIYVFLDMHRHFTPVTTRLIRDTARAVRTSRKSVIFIAPQYQLPSELEKEVTLAVFSLPDKQQLKPLLQKMIEELTLSRVPVNLTEDDQQAMVNALSGLTLNEAERAIRQVACATHELSADSVRRVAQTKSQIIRKSGILEYYDKCESMTDIGGLEDLRNWFSQRYPVFSQTARYAGLPVPKGVLLVGIPGCGKSLSARALAGAWGVPLLRLDIGRIFGSVVGQSESNLRLAIQTAEAVSPCILWIDEIEKGFAGSSGHVAARVFGTFLNWLQDKQSPVFVVATANDISRLPPELLRKGRFDEIFFVGLPGGREREDIFKIHLHKRHRDSTKFDIAMLARESKGFSGAEIEQAINDGLFLAYDDRARELQTEDIYSSTQRISPLSRTRGREIADLTEWARLNARMASANVETSQ